jgi:hypothetical protein
MSKYGLKVLGLSLLAALSLMALSAGAAQAVTHEVKILGKTFAELGIDEESLTGKIDTVGALLVTGQNLALTCAKFSVVEGKILLALPSKTVDAEGKILFEECKTKSADLTENLPCIVDDDVGTGLTTEHITADALILIVETGGVRYLLAEPLTGQTAFTKVDFLDEDPAHGKFCPLPDLVEITGSTAIEIETGTNAEKLIKEAPAAIQTALNDKLKFGESKATIDATGWVKLNGADAGKVWQVL